MNKINPDHSHDTSKGNIIPHLASSACLCVVMVDFKNQPCTTKRAQLSVNFNKINLNQGLHKGDWGAICHTVG